MTKYVECWGATKPFANITDSKMAKNIGLAVSSRSHKPSPLQNEFQLAISTNIDLFLFLLYLPRRVCRALQ